jgi:uracil-DNA glycosylase
MSFTPNIKTLQNRIVLCDKCLRLVKWREEVAQKKIARFMDWNYWGKPVPGWGDEKAKLLVVGLAPAAHGANRTGRMFTGDQSGKWLYKALYDFGFSSQSESERIDDGMKLNNCWITAVLHCAPPQNKPTTREIEICHEYLLDELKILKEVKVILALGKVAFESVIATMKELKLLEQKEKFKFAHGAELQTDDGKVIIASFHPSQQNTFTGRLRKPMFDGIFRRIKNIIKNQDYKKYESRISK